MGQKTAGSETYLDTRSKYRGKRYLKRIVALVANGALEKGARFIPPEGVVFRTTHIPKPGVAPIVSLWVVCEHVKGVSYFRARPFLDEGPDRVAYPSSVHEVVEIPDVCPPFGEWRLVDG